jgi:ribosome-associated protein
LARLAATALDEKQARDVTLLDVHGLTTITDYMMLATGGSPPQLKAMGTAVQQALKKHAILAYRTAGAPDSGWLVLDFVDVVIHLFSPQARAYYAIETLWEKAKRVA